MPRREKAIQTNSKFMECLNLRICSRYLLQIKPKASCAPWSIPGELLAAFALIMIFMCLAVNTIPHLLLLLFQVTQKILVHAQFSNIGLGFSPSCSLLPPFEFIPIFTSPPAPAPSPSLTIDFPFLHTILCSSWCSLMIFISAVFQEYLEFNPVL